MDSKKTKENSNNSVLKLDSEDYENIYLRVREKLGGFLWKLFGVTGVLGIIFLMVSSNAAITKYVESDSFKELVVDNVASRLAQLEKRERELIEALNLAEKRIVTLPNLPIAVSDKGITLIGVSGSRFHIETGKAKVRSTVTFNQAFSEPPTVLLVPISDRLGLPIKKNGIWSKTYPLVMSIEATITGFKLHSRNDKFYEYSWVAIGH